MIATSAADKSMTNLRLSILLACLMAISAAVGLTAKPSAKASDVGPRFVLEDAVPTMFGDWRELPKSGGYMVNPQTKELLDKLYSQTLTRTYIHSNGYRIMLSLAYGDDQRGDLQAHRPEVCYPAQGFALHSTQEAQVLTPFGSIAGRRLSTSLGSRKEPVTYWFTVGDTPVSSKVQQRMIEIKLGLTGQIPDGLLFRVSSIDDDTARAFGMQENFVADLLKATTKQARLRLSGLPPASD
jgi:EpsI family protein